MNTTSTHRDRKIIHDVNVRITGDERFWGTRYQNSVWAWRFSPSHLHLKEIAAAATLDDPFDSLQAIRRAHDACRALSRRYLGILARRLNALHGVDYPERFWKIAFGSWLYRHISVVYDKFATLRQLDPDATSLTLLAPDSYFAPNDHFEYMGCFCTDYGALQLASQYFRLFSAKDFPEARAECPCLQARRGWTNHHNSVIVDGVNDGPLRDAPRPPDQGRARVALCSAYYPEPVIRELAEKSRGEIVELFLPPVIVPDTAPDKELRDRLVRRVSDDPFEIYLAETLAFCTPKIFVEYFPQYHEAYARHVASHSYEAIVTECWDSFAPVTLYCALAKNGNATRLVLQQHGASLQWNFCHLQWQEEEVADTFLTTGFASDHPSGVAGGFLTRERPGYRFSPEKTEIVHVATTRNPYHANWATGLGGIRLLRYLQSVDTLIENLPQRLKPHYVLRARREEMLLDTERLWRVRERGLRLGADRDFLGLMTGSRIVVIDHISTGLAEILVNRIPFLFLFVPGFHAIAEPHAHVFDELFACKVAHDSPESLLGFLDSIYDDVEGWWMDAPVQRTMEKIMRSWLGPASLTKNHLLSLAQRP